MKAWGGLPGLGKGCQGSTLCSFLQVSERCLRLWSLATVDKIGTGSSALKILEKLSGSGKGYQGSKFCSYPTILQVSKECLRMCGLAVGDREGAGGSALQALGMLENPKNHYKR